MSEAPLALQVITHRPKFRKINGYSVLSPRHLIKGENAGFYGQTPITDGLVRRNSPSRGTDRKNMDVRGALNGFGFLNLGHKVKGVTGTGRSHVRNVMGRCNGRHVLFPGHLSETHLAHGRSGGHGSEGCGTGPLDARVHIRSEEHTSE